MNADLDLNDFDLINAGTVNADNLVVAGTNLNSVVGQAATSASNAAASATSAAASATTASQYTPAYFNNVAALLADTRAWPTGQILNTRAEGFSYQVAASGATNQHVTTAGGVKLYVLPGSSGYNVKAFGAVGDGTADDTAEIQVALSAANGSKLYFPEGTYLVSKGGGAYVLTVPNEIEIEGVETKSKIKLSSAAGLCYLLGSGTSCALFSMRGMVLDGNKSVVSAVNTSGLHLPEAVVVRSERNAYINFNDVGSFAGGNGAYLSSTTAVSWASFDTDYFSNLGKHAIQVYNTTQLSVSNSYGFGLLTSFVDTNPLASGENVRTKVLVNNNVVNCAVGFTGGNSVLSLLGDDIECVGNKITGGSVGIVVHDDTGVTRQLHNYNVSNNFLWDQTASAIVVNQTSATYGNNFNQGNVIANNTIYQPAADGIAILGKYEGTGATYGATTVTGNTIIDGRTENPTPEAYAGIRLLGATNVTVVGNVITAPRWAGILCHYDGRNIVISGNVITGHQGRTNTGAGTSTSQSGGAIFIGGGLATAYLGNISISDNVIENYATAVSPQILYQRTGAIVVNEAKAQDISIKNNRIKTGNTAGICLLSAVNVTVESNDVSGFYSNALYVVSPGAGGLLTYAISGLRYGTTANRPVLIAEQKGYEYYDASLTKPIWWNGTVWKDVSNATV
jgi:hypothetical protein